MKLIFIRHGEIIDKGDISYLTRKGIKQVQFLADRIKEFKIDRFYSSDFFRAKETSEIISRRIRVPVVYKECLQEFDEENVFFRKRWRKKDLIHLRELKKFLNSIKRYNGTILISGHGSLNRIIISYFFDLPLDNIFFFQQKHACINVIKYGIKDYGRKILKNYKLIAMNDVSHLPKKLRTVQNIKKV